MSDFVSSSKKIVTIPDWRMFLDHVNVVRAITVKGKNLQLTFIIKISAQFIFRKPQFVADSNHDETM